MLGRRSRQLSLSDTDEWWKRIPPTSRWAQVRQWSLAHWPDERFAAWYAEDGQGRPSIPPSYMVTLLLLQLLYGWSDRQAVDNAAFDDRVKFAVGVSRTPEILCDHSTLCKFRAKALAQDAGRTLLRETLREASAAGLLRDEADIIDSFMVAGAAARQGTLILIARAIRQVLVEADEAGLRPPALRRADYRDRRKPAIDWAGDAARHALLQDLVADAATLTAWAAAPPHPESLRQAAALLETVAAQDITRDPAGTVHIAQHVAPYRVLSVVDPEMRHGRKSSSQKFDGYKAHISVQRGDAARPRLVTAATVTPGNTPDGDQTVAVLQEREALTGAPPQALWGDTAYGGAPTRQAVADAASAVRLEAPVPPAVARDGRFPKTAFTIDCDAQTVTCPAGQTVPWARRRLPEDRERLVTVHFPGAVCGACELRAACTTGTYGRGVGITPTEGATQAERARQAALPWQTAYRQRTQVEHGIRGLTRGRDRATHYWGQRKTQMQIVWQAVGYNIRELFRVGHSPGGDVCPA